MGIRYDRDTRRATNGPLIFFSDPSSQEAFAEEVRGALISGLSFYSYRLPRDLMISFGSSEGIAEGIGTPGFVIGMFDPSLPYITIPYKGGRNTGNLFPSYSMPQRSTTYEEYTGEVKEIVKALKNYPYGKVVASRVEIVENPLDIAGTFFDYTRRFPDAMVFCFSTPLTGCWIGASPELLLQGSVGVLNSMALAGTRPAGTIGGWDEKNIEEQKIVADFIARKFRERDLNPVLGETFTKNAGAIEHICTPISATASVSESFNLEGLLRDLSPTPALCGSPKEFALEEIKRLENFERGCYGGFCGPFHSINDFTFNVVLRCASVEERKYCIYVGGGITLKSDSNEEWEETKIKITNILGL